MRVRVPIEHSEYGDEWDEQPITVSNVRFMSTHEVNGVNNGGVTSGYVFEQGSKGLILVDAANSENAFPVPAGAEIRVDSDERLEAVKVTKCLNFDGTLHHYEIEVK